MSINQQSFYLKSGDEHLACTALIPEKINSAVLMLLPFVEERKGALPLLLSIARELYQHNIASIIFDWRGSGDSSNEFNIINPDDFETDLNTAISWLKENTGNAPITAVGIRLSATFLSQLRHPEISQQILISPTLGDEFMRQLLQRRMVNDMVAYGKAIESRASLLKRLKDGESVDLDGYVFSPRLYNWIEKISIANGQYPIANIQYSTTSESNATPTTPHTHIPTSHVPHSTSHIPLPTSNVQHPTSNETDNTHTLTHPHTLLIPGGYSTKTSTTIADAIDNVESTKIRFPPFWNTVGHVDLNQLIESVTQWICSKTAPTKVAPLEKPDVKSKPLPPHNMQLMDIVSKNATIRAAIDSPTNTPKGGIIFLHGWSGDRTGPHRIFVELARRLTAEGYLCMRPDFKGRGLSDGEHESATIASMADDADTALSELKRMLPDGTPVYIAAICSGCKVAITLTAQHPEIAKMLLLSAESMGSLRSEKTDSNKTKKMLKTYLKKLTQLETWRKILTGKVQTGMVTKALVQHESRSDDEATTEDKTLREFEGFSNPIHFVFGGSDPDTPGSMTAYKAYCEKHAIPHTTHLVTHSGHSYYSDKWTQEVMETSISFLK